MGYKTHRKAFKVTSTKKRKFADPKYIIHGVYSSLEQVGRKYVSGRRRWTLEGKDQASARGASVIHAGRAKTPGIIINEEIKSDERSINAGEQSCPATQGGLARAYSYTSSTSSEGEKKKATRAEREVGSADVYYKGSEGEARGKGVYGGE